MLVFFLDLLFGYNGQSTVIANHINLRHMENLINIGVRSIFIDNMIFAYFLGMCSFLAISKKVSTAFGLGIAVVFVLGRYCSDQLVSSKLCADCRGFGLVRADFANVDLNFLQFIVFISVIAACSVD